jgi:ferredoxin-fold anticodon binding domain-containing protein
MEGMMFKKRYQVEAVFHTDYFVDQRVTLCKCRTMLGAAFQKWRREKELQKRMDDVSVVIVEVAGDRYEY